SPRFRTRMERQNGTNCGYLSTSATRSNMSVAEWRTRRLVENCGMLKSFFVRDSRAGARGLEPGEILPRMVRGARQRGGRDHRKTLRVGDRLQRLEFVGRHVADHRVVLAGRLQVLSDGEEIDPGRAQVVHHLENLVALLAEPHHDA